MLSYQKFIKKYGATETNIYLAYCIVENHKEAIKNGKNLSCTIEAEKGEIKSVLYKRT